MNAVFSFSSQPYLENQKKLHGNISNRLFLTAWIVAVGYAKKNFQNVNLITDKYGKTLLTEKLGLEFDKVTLELEKIQIPKNFWAAGKIVAYAKSRAPFIHIDYDAFLTKGLPKEAAKESIILEMKEDYENFTFYTHLIDAIKSAGYSKEICDKMLDLGYAYNCGIVGSKKKQIIKEYSEVSFDLINWLIENEGKLKLSDYQKKFLPIVFEQSILAVVLNENKIEPYLLAPTNEIARDNGYAHIKGGKNKQSVVKSVSSIAQKQFNFNWDNWAWELMKKNKRNKKYYE